MLIVKYVIVHSERYEIPIAVYNGNEQDIDKFIDYFSIAREEYLEKGREGSVNYKVSSYFFEGMYHLAMGDKYFWEENYELAEADFTDAQKYITRFINSRARNSPFDQLARRMVHRLTGMQSLSLTLPNLTSITDEKHIQDAISQFNSESGLATEVQEKIAAMIAFSRALFADALLWISKSKKNRNKNSFESKINLMKARALLKQVRFFDSRSQKLLNYTEATIEELTKNRVQIMAEKFENKGEKFAELGEFKKSKKFFTRATLFYNRASSLTDTSKMRRIFLANEATAEGAIFECDANLDFLGNNNLLKATQLFNKAATQIEKGIALLSTFGDAHQNASLKSKLNYYLGMSALIEGINYYDLEKYEKSANSYENSKKLLNKSSEEAKPLKNKIYKKRIENALNDLKGYNNMIEVVKS